MSRREVAVLGVGMHPWGKWGRNFIEYGVAAARAAIEDAGVRWRDVEFISGGSTMRNGYPGYVAGASFAEALGWSGASVASCYAACASGSQAVATARAQILSGACEVALVVGADTTPKGFLAPQQGDRPDDRDWARFRLGVTNATYFGLYARRRMELHGATLDDFARVKVKNAEHGLQNPNARYQKVFSVEEVAASAVVASPLRLLDICATSDGGAAVVLCSLAYAKRHGVKKPVRLVGVSTTTPHWPVGSLEMPYLASDSASQATPRDFRSSIATRAYEEAGLGAKDISVAEVYDLSTALELDWYEDLGLCAEGDAERLLRDGATRIGGRLPVNPSGGLACFGEAVPAQALAQMCEIVWQLRGAAGARQVEKARVGITANQGLFGHGSAMILKR